MTNCCSHCDRNQQCRRLYRTAGIRRPGTGLPLNKRCWHSPYPRLLGSLSSVDSPGFLFFKTNGDIQIANEPAVKLHAPTKYHMSVFLHSCCSSFLPSIFSMCPLSSANRLKIPLTATCFPYPYQTTPTIYSILATSIVTLLWHHDMQSM
jgi:hypothetical protein